MKVEIELPEEIYNFFKARAILKQRKLDEEISEYLKKEAKQLQNLPFKDAIT